MKVDPVQTPIPLHPYDAHNQRLESLVRPREWQNPEPRSRYNLVVIGAGPAGLVAARGAAGLGARVALVERGMVGGDCLNVGCVPSKAVIRAGRVAATVRQAEAFGIQIPAGWRTDFSRVMQRVRQRRADLAEHDAVRNLQKEGIDVFFGQATFIDRETVAVEKHRLAFASALIATGTRAAEPPISGLASVGPLTNQSLFSLTALPPRLLVIGGGPVGCEMAQAFSHLGSRVVLVESSDRILPHDEADAAEVVQAAMIQSGVQILTSSRCTDCQRRDDGKAANVERNGQSNQILADEILVATGRQPNVDNLGLDAVGIQFDERGGIDVDDHLRTTISTVFAAGDVASSLRFTHAADHMARIVIQNALFKGRKKASKLLIPWCTYTTPELAHVGLTPHDAEKQGVALDSYTQHLSSVDRAVLDGEASGFVRIHTKRGTDKILGATIVASRAGDLISELTMAIQHKVGLKRLAATIHPYPTQAEAIRKLGDQYNRTRLTPLTASLLRKWLSWSR